jgi:hypothetical protein
MESDNCKLIFVNVYMPFEDGEGSNNDFADQLFVVENIVRDNSDCHSIIDGDFNMDLARNWIHNALLQSSCDDIDLHFMLQHEKSAVDYTYNFNMCRFNTIDHFLVSSVIYHNCVLKYSVFTKSTISQTTNLLCYN